MENEVKDAQQAPVEEAKTRADKKAEKKEMKKAAELEKKIQELEKQLEDARKSAEDAKKAADKEKADYLRLMAEFETFRRRNAEDRLALLSTAAGDTIKDILPVLDSFDSAFKMTADASALEGIKLIYDNLMTILKGKGVDLIKAQGEVFDTDFHEAVTQFPAPSEDLKGKVIDVIQAGYTLNGKILRYAKVVVGA